jgi:5-aminopentanamidase
MTLRLAVWQGAGEDPLDELARAAERAAGEGAGLLVCPEGFLTGYHRPGLGAGDLRGVPALLARAAEIAAANRLPMILGTHLAEDEIVRNAAVVFDAAGAEIGRYRKRALFGDWERRTFVPGPAPLRFEVGGLKVGVLICYDVEFPELVRAEARAGAELVAVPTALMAPWGRVSRTLVPARALENQLFVAYANRTGEEAGLDYTGLSRICGPDGGTLAEAGAEPGLILADLDLAAIRAERAEASYLDDLARVERGAV